MKRTSVLFIIVFLVSVATQAAAKDTDFRTGSEPDGFRGIKWGTHVNTLEGMTRTGSDPAFGGVDNYTRSSDELQIGGAKLSSLTYGFWRQQFFSVRAEAKGFQNCRVLLEAAQERFGHGAKDELTETYVWSGPITRLMFERDEIRNRCTLQMVAEHYRAERAKEREEKGF